jgi:hypothetical protein
MKAIRIRDTVINLSNVSCAQCGMLPALATPLEEPCTIPGVVIYYTIPGTTTSFRCETEKEAQEILQQIETAMGL